MGPVDFGCMCNEDGLGGDLGMLGIAGGLGDFGILSVGGGLWWNSWVGWPFPNVHPIPYIACKMGAWVSTIILKITVDYDIECIGNVKDDFHWSCQTSDTRFFDNNNDWCGVWWMRINLWYW